LRVADAQIDLAPEFTRARRRDLEHRRTQLDAGQPHVVAVVGQFAAGAETDLEHLTFGLAADPLAAACKQEPVEEVHLAVVLVRLLLVQPKDRARSRAPLGYVWPCPCACSWVIGTFIILNIRSPPPRAK
jgi:hypothetical protein